MKKTTLVTGVLLALSFLAFPARADLVNQGAVLRIDSGTLRVGGSFVNQSGGSVALQGKMAVSGDWRNQSPSGGVFTDSSAGEVVLDGSGQSISGATSFPGLTKQVDAADTVTFQHGAANLSTVRGPWTFEGAAGASLALRSDADSQRWQVSPLGSTSLKYLSVKDSDNVSGTLVDATAPSMVDAGNNYAWKFKYDALFVAGLHGSLEGDTEQAVSAGESCSTVTAIPDGHCHFVQWTKDGLPYAAEAALTVADVQEDLSFHASFALDQLTVTFFAGPNGSLEGETVQTVDYGADCLPVTAVPDSGYHFVQWSDGSLANPLNVADVTAASSYTASFAANTGTATLTLASSPETGGSTDPSGSLTVSLGSPTTAKATAAANWRFDHWAVSGGATVADSTAAEGVITLSSDGGATANFVREQVVLTMAATAGGAITPVVGAHLVDAGTPVEIEATALPGYSFVSWTVAGAGSVADSASALTTVTLTGAATVTATFQETAVMVVLSVSNVSPVGAGTVVPAAGPSSAEAGTDIPITATASAGFAFSGWAVEGNAVVADPDAVSTTIRLSGDATLRARFADATVKAILTTASEPSEGGSISPSGSNVYGQGSLVPVKATAGEGFKFLRWNSTGGVSLDSIYNPSATATLTGDAKVLAVFAADSAVANLTFKSDDDGSVSVDGSLNAVTGTTCHLRAKSVAGRVFVRWTLESGDAEILTPYSTETDIVLNGEASVVAVYSKVVADDLITGKVKLFIDNRGVSRDKLRIKRSALVLDSFDPASDAVSLVVDGNVFDLDAEGFRSFREGTLWIYQSTRSDRPYLRLKLDLKRKLFQVKLNRGNFEGVSNQDGVNLRLQIGARRFMTNRFMDERNSRRFRVGKDSSEPLPVETPRQLVALQAGDLRVKYRDLPAGADRLRVRKATLALPEGMGFDPAADAVALQVGGVSAVMKPGSFRAASPGAWTYSDKEGLSMKLDLKAGTWSFSVKRQSIWNNISRQAKVDVYLTVGDASAGLQVDFGVNRTWLSSPATTIDN